MSVLIKGIGMPKDGEHPYWVAIHPNGTVEYNENKGQGWQISEAVPVPPHGRLIDAKYIRDAIIQEWMDKAGDSHMYKCGMEDAYEVIRNAPSIIPADESNMDSFIRIFEEDDEEDGMDSFIRILKD